MSGRVLRVYATATISVAATRPRSSTRFRQEPPRPQAHLFGNHASGIEEWKRSAEGYFAAFPDFRAPIEFTIVEGDMVAVRWRGSGTHQGELRGIAPTGTHVEITGVAIFRVDASEIAELWSQPDQMGMLQQIGAS